MDLDVEEAQEAQEAFMGQLNEEAALGGRVIRVEAYAGEGDDYGQDIVLRVIRLDDSETTVSFSSYGLLVQAYTVEGLEGSYSGYTLKDRDGRFAIRTLTGFSFDNEDIRPVLGIGYFKANGARNVFEANDSAVDDLNEFARRLLDQGSVLTQPFQRSLQDVL